MRALAAALGAWLLAAAACSREDILVAEVETPATSASVPPHGVCHENEPCGDLLFCERASCDDPFGKCAPRPSPCELGPPECGCDGNSYPGSCFRRAVGVSLAHPGHCKTHP